MIDNAHHRCLGDLCSAKSPSPPWKRRITGRNHSSEVLASCVYGSETVGFTVGLGQYGVDEVSAFGILVLLRGPGNSAAVPIL